MSQEHVRRSSLKRSRGWIALGAAGLLLGTAWVGTAPPAYVEIAPTYVMAEVADSIRQVQAAGDPIALDAQTLAPQVPGYDDVVLQETLQRAFVTAMDGRIWKLDLASGTAEPFVDPPLMAAGARAVPGDDNRLYFCASRLYGASYADTEQVGLYELEISSKTVRPLLTHVPMPPPRTDGQGVVFADGARPHLAVAAMTKENSRPIAFCNDLDVSRDGQRIYFSEPFAYPGASMGGGAFYEGIGLGRNGRLWMYDVKQQEVSLIAQGYTFIDGVLLEGGAANRETSVLITETPKFRILRFHLEQGTDEEIWHSLPGMPDGMDRDAQGRIWIGLLKDRSPALTWVHAHPWIKPLLMRLPRHWPPQSHNTAILALSADAKTPLYYARHDGSRAAEISVVVPGKDRLYLPSFSPRTPGVHTLPYPPPAL